MTVSEIDNVFHKGGDQTHRDDPPHMRQNNSANDQTTAPVRSTSTKDRSSDRRQTRRAQPGGEPPEDPDSSDDGGRNGGRGPPRGFPGRGNDSDRRNPYRRGNGNGNPGGGPPDGGGSPTPNGGERDRIPGGPDPAYGTVIPTIDPKLKLDSIPEWDGNYDTAIDYFWDVGQMAALGGWMPQALGFWLATRLKKGSA
ncbi:hypothetical protein FB451DRAFT_1560479, partial [Mycena latifolia]